MQGAPTVVVDTNEWIATKWLSTPIGRTFCDFVCSGKVVLALPEVLQLELEKHRSQFSSDIITRASTALADLERAAGIPYPLPEPREVEAAISARLAPIYSAAIRLAITQEHARSALKRINEGSPPNGPKNQQAKDSLLWEACLELAETRRVSLVTRDGGFYLDRNPERGLARNLAAEPAVVLGRLAVHPSLEEFLRTALPDEVNESQGNIDRLVEEKSREYIQQSPDFRKYFMTLGEAEVRLRGFPGQQRDEMTLAFTIRFTTEQDANTETGFVELKGECSFNRTRRDIRDFQIRWWVASLCEADEEEEPVYTSDVRRWLAERGEREWP